MQTDAPISALRWSRPPTHLGRRGLGAVNVEHRLPLSCADHHDPRLLGAWVALAMNAAGLHLHEVTGSSLERLTATRTKLHPKGARQHEDGGLVVTVVVPA